MGRPFGKSGGSKAKAAPTRPYYDFHDPGGGKGRGHRRGRWAAGVKGMALVCLALLLCCRSPPSCCSLLCCRWPPRPPCPHADRLSLAASSPAPRAQDAEAARERYRAADDEVHEIERKVEALVKKTKTDYGPGMRFEKLSRECVEFKPGGEFSYDLCPYR